MRKTTMPNFYINFLNKAAKSLPILYDFAVASFSGVWIKILKNQGMTFNAIVASFGVRGLKSVECIDYHMYGSIPRGCVD